MIDTGFDGGLQLPISYVPTPLPDPDKIETYEYANGDIEAKYTYLLPVTVGGVEYVCETIFGPVAEVHVGADLLRHFRLTIDFPAGTVELT